MDKIITLLSLLLITFSGLRKVSCESSPLDTSIHEKIPEKDTNPLIHLLIKEDSRQNESNSETPKVLSRVKRQYYYDPYYRPYPVPVPIIIGGGFIGGFGYRGFGFGGRGYGFGGRGFGGRGFGGFGGRGFGGFGGRGRG